MNLRVRNSIIPFAALALLVLLAACGDGNGDDEDPDEVIENAVEAFRETETAHFVLDMDGSISVDADGMLEVAGIEGEIERPASARADASVNFAGSSVTMEVIAVDGDMYMRNLLSGEWEQAPSDIQYDPARLFDDEQGISAIISQLEDLELEGEDSIDGDDAWHLTTSVPEPFVRSLAADFFSGEVLDVDIWVATDDYRLLRVQVHDSEADEPLSWELTFSEHDEPVEITPPDLD